MTDLDDYSDTELAILMVALRARLSECMLALYKPYAKQLEFHALGIEKRERMLSAGNQLGKTLSAGAEVAMHLTGRYPDWWKGKRFTRGNHWLAGSVSTDMTKKGIQKTLFGRDPKTAMGTGMIPKECIVGVTWARHASEMVETVRVRFTAEDGTESISSISLKSYEQGREKWQADTVDGIWFDEEPPDDIYSEGITRTNVAFGPVLVTCTLLSGMTTIAARFWLERDKWPDVGIVNMTIDDVDHYTAEQKAKIIASYPAHERDARTKGIPSLGSGRIFPVDEELIKCKAFPIPAFWPQIGGLDFGWDHPSAAVKLALDPDMDIVYVTACHRQKEQTPLLFSETIKPWGLWLPWAWPHDGLQHSKHDGTGEQLKEQYKGHGLNMLEDKATHPPEEGEAEGTGGNSVEAGVLEILNRMQTGRWKVFDHLEDYMEEFRLYHRKDGKIVKLRDDLLSAGRYAYMMRRFAITKPAPVRRQTQTNYGARRGAY